MTIITVYWILFLLGLGFALISAVFVGFGEAFGGHDVDFSAGHDMDVGGVDTVDFGGVDAGGHVDMDTGDFFHGHGEIAFSPVSPITIFSFVGGFGGGGIIANGFGWPLWATVFFAVPVGFLLAFGIYYFMVMINRSNISSEARASEVVGLTAEMITPIVEEGVGEVAYISRGSRYTAPARSIDGKSIGKGRAVKVWRIVGSTCYVKEILPEEAEHPGTDTLDHPDRE